MTYEHVPVLLNETLEYLDPQPGQNFVDCTLGGGGHALEILKRVMPEGRVLGIDLDEKALESVMSKVHKVNNLVLVQDNFANLKNILDEKKFYPVHGILMDLGISSAEYEESGRGFSFQKKEPLDMRFGKDTTSCVSTADEIINSWHKEELAKIFKEYGEEPLAMKIADRIVNERKENKIDNTKQLADLIFGEYKKAYKNKTFKKHPATKVFQALRIAVNDELGNLEKILPQTLEILESGGRVAVISFHSLEDRIVKNFFQENAKGCVCPPEFPVCICHHEPKVKILTKHPVDPSREEIEKNPRARSAKLRVAEKI